jgi:CheY-like chemotaxis protein
MEELRRHTKAVLEMWKALDWAEVRAFAPTLDDVRRELLIAGFYAFSMERVVGARARDLPAPVIESLTPLRIAVHDYAQFVSAGSDRQIDLIFSREDRAMDARLLQPVCKVLQHLVGDVCLRCREASLRIEVGVEEKNGALLWTLRDNGENFVADSHVDRDEYLAFYPGLRETRKILGELRSLLWVEPHGSAGRRFAFTTPVSVQDGSFMVWGTGGDGVAVLSSQLGDVHRVEDIQLTLDSRGERATIDGRQVRVVRLGQVYPRGCIDGDRIVVIGSLEKRIAFYMEGDGRLEKGVWKQDGVSAGRGMGSGMIQIGDARFPLVEADGLLQRYMATVDVVSEEDVSGGVDVNVSSLSHTQATREKDAKTPPEKPSKKGDVDVLVVEQNETLRKTLGVMLSRSGFTTRTVDGLDAAHAFLDKNRASVIISDFRVPSMSARAVVERLRRESRRIPVLVTTSHRGDNAQTLVERLGVSGYISKPLSPDEIVSRVARYVGRLEERAARRP